MNWTSFTSIPAGTRIFNHGFDQCVAVANLYHESVIGGAFVPVQSAYQWWTQQWPQVAALYTRSTRPVAGALAVWDTRWGAGHGHIGVVIDVHADGRFTAMEQNAGSGQYRYLNRYHRSTVGVLGFLVPKVNPARRDQTGDSVPTRPHVKEKTMARFIGSYIGTDRNLPARERSCVIYDPQSGFYTTWSGVDQEYTNEMARVYGTANFNFITKKHWDQTIRPRLDEIRLRK